MGYEAKLKLQRRAEKAALEIVQTEPENREALWAEYHKNPKLYAAIIACYTKVEGEFEFGYTPAAITS
jgi:hypothetical protein